MSELKETIKRQREQIRVGENVVHRQDMEIIKLQKETRRQQAALDAVRDGVASLRRSFVPLAPRTEKMVWASDLDAMIGEALAKAEAPKE